MLFSLIAAQGGSLERHWTGVLACLALVPGLIAGEQPDPLGSEFQVNSHTPSFQVNPVIGPDCAGGVVIVWLSDSSSGTDSSGWSIQGQCYASAGSPAGNQFQVNTYTTSTQAEPAVGPDGGGGFVVVWYSNGSSGTDSSSFSIQGQRYAPDGSPAGSQFQVNSYTSNFQLGPTIGPTGDGGFVVAWVSDGSNGTDSSVTSIQGQRYASDGSPAGSQFQVNSYTSSDQIRPVVGPDGAGGFVIVWESAGSSGNDSSSFSIQGQRYAADGSPAGGEFQVNSYAFGVQSSAAVSSDGAGGFVVTWYSNGSNGSDSSSTSIQAQRFASDGSPDGVEFQINSYTSGGQFGPAVSPNGAGGFVVTWHSYGSSGNDSGGRSIQGQSFASDGMFEGSEFQINTYVTGDQSSPAVGPNGPSGFVVAWDSEGSSGNDSSSYSIQGQRFGQLEIFADGFESGDLSAWSVVVP